MSKELIEKFEERRIARKEFLKKPTLDAVRERYRKLNKDVKRLVKSTKRQQLEKKIEKMEADFRANNSHNLFKVSVNLKSDQNISSLSLKIGLVESVSSNQKKFLNAGKITSTITSAQPFRTNSKL